MSECCETVKIVHPDGYCIINKSDFVEGVHILFVEPVEPPKEPDKMVEPPKETDKGGKAKK